MTCSVIVMITKALVTAGLPTPMSSAVGRYAISVETFLTCLSQPSLRCQHNGRREWARLRARGESRSVGDRDTITVVRRHATPRAERLVINGGACTVQQPGAHYSSRDGQHLSIMRSLLARPSPKPSTPPPPASRTMAAASERIRSDGRRPSPVIRGNE